MARIIRLVAPAPNTPRIASTIPVPNCDICDAKEDGPTLYINVLEALAANDRSEIIVYDHVMLSYDRPTRRSAPLSTGLYLSGEKSVGVI